MAFRLDGGRWIIRRVVGAVAGNVGALQGGVALLPEADPADGLLDLALLRDVNARGWLVTAGKLVGSRRMAWQTLRKHGGVTLVKDAFVRFRYGDGFSHARALGLQISLAAIPLVIAFVGLSRTLDTSLGQVYGPLTGIMALLLWGQLTAMSALYGLSFAAQLEAVRAGVRRAATDDPARSA
ncbi:hypothetical protein [Saccharothrix carnea]|uniref:hypothetical protein n=1 Tax=Saccharothrix carnea TaxID=1280637 RepID=UPI0011B267B7|nr:hypothetical protein [Saccharothrix carnea]